MKRFLIGWIGGVLLLSAGVDALALATSNDVISAQSPTNMGYTLNWDYVYSYKVSSSVAIDHYWILTAAHVADDNVSSNLVIDGETYTQKEIVFHSQAADPDSNATADLALVRFDKPFPGYYPLHAGEIYTGKRFRDYAPLVMVGFGYPGDVTLTTFTQSGSRGTKRWGTNRGTDELKVNGTKCFKMTFNLANTKLEAGANVYDSGGPVFIDAGTNDWKLAGITLFRQPNDPPYTENYSAKVSDYIGWIKSVITDYDTDRDGLPDWWEQQYAGSATAMSPDANPDDDRFTNYEEWICDTNPTNSTSCFGVIYEPPSQLLINHTSTNRQYQIEFSPKLPAADSAWSVEKAWFNGTSTQMVETVAGSLSNGFYRVRVGFK